MTLDAGTIIALVSLVGVIYTGTLASKGKNAENKNSGMDNLNDALQEELRRKNEEIARMDERIRLLERDNETLRSVIRGDQR